MAFCPAASSSKGLNRAQRPSIVRAGMFNSMKTMHWILSFGMAALVIQPSLCVYADEGMWLFNDPPRKQLKERYNFDATDAWLEHVQKSSVRFNSGGSGSFVSEDGLILSNHHVGADTLQKVSTKEKDYLKTGFYARTPEEE